MGDTPNSKNSQSGFQRWVSRWWPATRYDAQQLQTQLELIMATLKEFIAAQTAYNDRQDAAIAGIQGDVQGLNDLIVKLQTTPGPISPEDQASLDALQARGLAVATKLEALDASVPPAPPAV